LIADRVNDAIDFDLSMFIGSSGDGPAILKDQLVLFNFKRRDSAAIVGDNFCR
jgi:hypothetical protein